MEPPAKQLCVFTGQGIGPSYTEWKLRVLATLDERQIRSSVLMPADFQNVAARRTYIKNDAILYNLLLTSLSGEALLFAMQNFGLKEETPEDSCLGYQLFVALKSKYFQAMTHAEELLLRMKLMSAKFSSTAVQFTNHVLKVRHDLLTRAAVNYTQAKVNSLDFDLYNMTLAQLPVRFANFVAMERAKPEALIDIVKFFATVEFEERQVKSVPVTQAQRSHQHNHESLACAQKNSKDWRMKKEEKNRKEKGSSLEPKSILFSKPNSIKQFSYFLSHRSNFMLDTGATDHFVNDRKLLSNFIEEKSFIWLADNSKAECPGHGTMFWKTNDKNGKEITIKLKSVRVIPNLHQNILSLSAIFQQYQNATEIRRDDNNFILKIRNNEIELSYKENCSKI